MKKTMGIFLAAVMMISIFLPGCASIAKLKDGSIKTSDGEIVTGDNVKWPDTNMGGLTKPNAKITAVLKDDKTGNYTVAFSDMDKEKAAQYVEMLKTQGYKSVMEVNDADGIIYSGQNSSGVAVTFTYNNTAREGTISYVPTAASGTGDSVVSQDPASLDNTSKDTSSQVDMTDASPWPQNFMTGVPEMNGKITNVLNQNDENITVELEYVKKADFEAYVADIKKNGYTVDADEIKDTYSYEYRAYSKTGDCIHITMNYEYEKATVYMEKAVKEE